MPPWPPARSGADARGRSAMRSRGRSFSATIRRSLVSTAGKPRPCHPHRAAPQSGMANCAPGANRVTVGLSGSSAAPCKAGDPSDYRRAMFLAGATTQLSRRSSLSLLQASAKNAPRGAGTRSSAAWYRRSTCCQRSGGICYSALPPMRSPLGMPSIQGRRLTESPCSGSGA